MKKILSGLFLLLAIHCTAGAQTAPAFWPEIVAFKKMDAVQPPPAHPILFVGSSSFTKWKDVNDYFPGYTIINRGFGGSTLVDVIRYAYDVIIPYHPKQVVIYCGENDLAAADSISVREVVTRFKTLYGMIRQNLPGATIDFISMKASPSREKIFPKIREANNLVKAFLAKERNAGFIDIYPAMLDAQGKPREELFLEDRLHMKPAGYAIWKKIILPYLLK